MQQQDSLLYFQYSLYYVIKHVKKIILQHVRNQTVLLFNGTFAMLDNVLYVIGTKKHVRFTDDILQELMMIKVLAFFPGHHIHAIYISHVYGFPHYYCCHAIIHFHKVSISTSSGEAQQFLILIQYIIPILLQGFLKGIPRVPEKAERWIKSIFITLLY